MVTPTSRFSITTPRFIALGVALLMGGTLAACGGAAPPPGIEPAPGASGPPIIFGYVWMPDSVTAAAGALIFTEPFSDQVTADSTGYFEIARGLQPGEYLIRADLDGVLGDVNTDGPLVGGDYGPLHILIGAQDRTWVPALETGDGTNTTRSARNAGGGRTCCEEY